MSHTHFVKHPMSFCNLSRNRFVSAVNKKFRRLCFLLLVVHSAKALAIPPSINLQSQHTDLTPSDSLRQLSEVCHELGISGFDVYGDFGLDANTSYLKRFESEIAAEFGKEDAVFMPSGVMAQGIALLIHGGTTFACHHSSHMLLHEEQSYRHLIQMTPLVIDTKKSVANNGYSIPAMSFDNVKNAFEKHDGENGDSVSTLVIELPHRELGGKCTSWEDIVRMQALCKNRGIKFHCDGARIFEATSYYSNSSLKEIASLFDSIYISFYKGLGGLSGAMLLGNASFCEEARTWLRRFGGNLYTLLPYAVSGWVGYRRNWLDSNDCMSFAEKHKKLVRLVKSISMLGVVSFDPETPEVNMVHGYFRQSVDGVNMALGHVEQVTGIRVLTRVAKLDESTQAYQSGYRSKFEWTLGTANGRISDADFLIAWKALAAQLKAISY